MRIGVYAGSFDPVTNGHLWMIKQAALLFDELNLWVAVNPDKKYRFSSEKRQQILEDIVFEMSKTLPTKFVVAEIRDGFLVNHVKDLAIRRNCGPSDSVFLVRGIRNSMDFELERPMRHMNSKISDGKIETVFLMTPKEVEDISSSLVKGMVGPLGWGKVVKPLVPPQTYAALEEDVGWKKWSDLCGRLGITKQESAQAVYRDLVKRYREPHRHYHTLNHILATLEHVQYVRGEGAYVSEAVELALWFHDAVYAAPDVERTNEQRSADLAVSVLNRLNRGDLAPDVGDAILATTGHAATDSIDRLTVEADLAILCAEPQDYDEYVRQIRAEYSVVPDELFYPGRHDVMKNLLDVIKTRDVFFSKGFVALRHRAEENIARELETILKMQFPKNDERP